MNLLRQLRGESKQSEVAKIFGITQSHYGFLENGIRTPSLMLAKKISDYYHISIEEIFLQRETTKCYPNNLLLHCTISFCI